MAIDPKSVPLVRVSWRPSYRLIPSRFPTVGLFDAIANPADLDAVFAIEGLANPRLRDEIGELQLVPPDERVSGPGTTPVMAAFTHLNPEGSRFSDGSYGVYYAAHSLQTSLAEVSFHRAVFLRRTAETAIDLDLRLITASVEAELHDLGSASLALSSTSPFAVALEPDDYGPPQRLGRALRDAGSWGHPLPEASAIEAANASASSGRAPFGARRRRRTSRCTGTAGASRTGSRNRRRTSSTNEPRQSPAERLTTACNSVQRRRRCSLRRRTSRRQSPKADDSSSHGGRGAGDHRWHGPCGTCSTLAPSSPRKPRPCSTCSSSSRICWRASTALGAIVATDLRLLAKFSQDKVRIAPPNEFVTRIVMLALLMLYVTGGAIVWHGLGQRADYLENPKLQAKILLVVVLTINAFILHKVTFPRLARGRRVVRWNAADWVVVAVPVAVSNFLWMFTAFLGIARPWNFAIPASEIFAIAAALYVVTQCGVVVILATAGRKVEPGQFRWADRLAHSLAALGNLGKTHGAPAKSAKRASRRRFVCALHSRQRLAAGRRLVARRRVLAAHRRAHARRCARCRPAGGAPGAALGRRSRQADWSLSRHRSTTSISSRPSRADHGLEQPIQCGRRNRALARCGPARSG